VLANADLAIRDFPTKRLLRTLGRQPRGRDALKCFSDGLPFWRIGQSKFSAFSLTCKAVAFARGFPDMGLKFPIPSLREVRRKLLKYGGEPPQDPQKRGHFCKIPVYFPGYRELALGDRFAPDCAHHHPVFGFGPSQVISQFVRGNRGFPASGVSLNLSLLGDEPAFAALSLRGKFPFPAHGGDRFDDWVVDPGIAGSRTARRFA
jgi:hypothetical protein